MGDCIFCAGVTHQTRFVKCIEDAFDRATRERPVVRLSFPRTDVRGGCYVVRTRLESCVSPDDKRPKVLAVYEVPLNLGPPFSLALPADYFAHFLDGVRETLQESRSDIIPHKRAEPEKGYFFIRC